MKKTSRLSKRQTTKKKKIRRMLFSPCRLASNPLLFHKSSFFLRSSTSNQKSSFFSFLREALQSKHTTRSSTASKQQTMADSVDDMVAGDSNPGVGGGGGGGAGGASGAGGPSAVTCYGCGGTGHFKRDCPSVTRGRRPYGA